LREKGDAAWKRPLADCSVQFLNCEF